MNGDIDTWVRDKRMWTTDGNRPQTSHASARKCAIVRPPSVIKTYDVVFLPVGINPPTKKQKTNKNKSNKNNT